jgi:hypothetical protein
LAVTAEVTVAKIVGHDKDDIGSRRFIASRRHGEPNQYGEQAESCDDVVHWNLFAFSSGALPLVITHVS